MSKLVAYLDRTFYLGYEGNWDDCIFRGALLEKMKSEYVCLDCGAGRGRLTQMDFKGVVKFVAGVDLDDEVYRNPYLDEAKLIDVLNNVIPYKDSTFDLVFSDNVMEHVQNPYLALREIFRVLKPGGCFLSKTPNK